MTEYTEYIEELRLELDGLFNPTENSKSISWAVAIKEFGDCYVVKVERGLHTQITGNDIPANLYWIVWWTFSENGRVALIRLPKPLSFGKVAAALMAGNLFGQGLSREMNLDSRGGGKTMGEIGNIEPGKTSLKIAIDALLKIKDEGIVCGNYDTCKHSSCKSSHTAWVLADEALKKIETNEGACQNEADL